MDKDAIFMKNMYRAIMDSSNNPLRKLPLAVRFQTMTVLAYMWSVIFCVWAGTIEYLGMSIISHSALLLGILITLEVFRNANDRDSSLSGIN